MSIHLALLRKIRNTKICMGKKPIVSVTYENERISITNSLPYIKYVFHSWSCFKTLFSSSGKLMSTGAGDCLPPRVWVMVAEIGDLWFALGAKASWSNVTNGKQIYRVLPRRNLEATGAVGAEIGPFSFGGSVGPPRGGGDTLGISGLGCAAGTLEPLTYTRTSSAEFCYPILE